MTKKHRCADCGKLLVIDRFGNGGRCNDHPRAKRIVWQSAQVNAYRYVTEAHEQGYSLDELIAAIEKRPTLWPGVTIGDIGQAWGRYEKWGVLPELRTRPVNDASGLYGPTTQGENS